VVPNTDASITSLKSVGIKEIIIEVNQETSNVKIIVKGYNSKPTNVTKEVSGKVYRYLEIDAENLNSNLDKATVKFEVNKSWFPDNSLNKEDLDVYKFNHTSQEWNSLSANYESENGDYYVYTIEINSFSFFAVAEKARIPIISDIIESYDKAGETIFGLIVWWLVFGILLVGIILVGFLIKKEIQK
jgi:PGF-pre-PGF domain-containing protein